jgi:uncharacterized protein YegL
MTKLKEFTTSTARPLPVVVLADVSGSMSGDGKIQALNQAVREMLDTFRGEDDLRAEIHVAVVTFGGEARLHVPLTTARQVTWNEMPATGGTPMGAAFAAAMHLIEDRQTLPARAYAPTLVLVSDGQPTDEWRAPLEALLASPRGGKAFRMAMAIGADADISVLEAFLGQPGAKIYRADDARQIRNFFNLVTMSVTQRSRSATPDAAPSPSNDEGWEVG